MIIDIERSKFLRIFFFAGNDFLRELFCGGLWKKEENLVPRGSLQRRFLNKKLHNYKLFIHTREHAVRRLPFTAGLYNNKTFSRCFSSFRKYLKRLPGLAYIAFYKQHCHSSFYLWRNKINSKNKNHTLIFLVHLYECFKSLSDTEFQLVQFLIVSMQFVSDLHNEQFLITCCSRVS